MDRIRRLAELSVARGCAFALLGISTFVLGLSGEPGLAIRSAAILLTLMAVVLWHRGRFAEDINYRRREVWLMMGSRADLPEDRLHHLISSIMREVYLTYARRIGAPAAACWMVDLGARLVG
ncbi:MAG: hypothetical protein AB1918_06695 [Pseudomonadota bacterium]